jgi:gliding motility-associated-like protein
MRALGGDSYKWLPVANFSGSSSPEIKVAPLSTTVYTIEMEDKVCNEIEVMRTEIKVNALPKIALSKSNHVDCSKTISQLSATGGSNFEWAPTEFLSNRFIAQPIAFPNTPTRFYVTVTSEEGCKAKDSILVNVTNTRNESFHIPNAFTPNNDGKNDCFGVRYWGRAEDFTLNIFNRWGEKVFSTKSPSDCWNGIYKGIQQPGGVYVYYITGKTFCGTITRKGTITLLR